MLIVVVMERLNYLLCEALVRYFTVLNKTGYKKQSDVNVLLLLMFLQELLENYEEFIDNYDYNIISDIITCLYDKSCLVPFDTYKHNIEVTNGYINRFSYLHTQYFAQVKPEEVTPQPIVEEECKPASPRLRPTSPCCKKANNK